MVTSVVRFGAGQRKLYKSELRKLDVHWRKLLRQVVGPPGSIDWTQPWHSIWHQWNQRVVEQVRSGQVRPVRQRRARFRAQAQKVKICTQLLFTCGKNRVESSRVEPVRQKMAGPIGHRREKEMKREQSAKYIHEI